jgi:hypothetical protein
VHGEEWVDVLPFLDSIDGFVNLIPVLCWSSMGPGLRFRFGSWVLAMCGCAIFLVVARESRHVAVCV